MDKAGLTTRLDAWVNALTGLGGLRDKSKRLAFAPNAVESDRILEALYHGDDLAASIVDGVPDGMLRRSFGIKTDDIEESAAIDEALRVLKATDRLLDALVWERVFGGAAIFVGVRDGGKAIDPVNESAIESIDFLTTIEGKDIKPWSYYENVDAPHFGEPATYRLDYLSVPNAAKEPGRTAPPNHGMIEIHASRIIAFEGGRATREERQRRQGWGVPELERIKPALENFSSNWLSISHLITDASQAVFKIKGLIDMITSGNKDQLMTRMEMVDMARSVARAILLDADLESFERKDTSMSGLPELTDRTMMRLAAAARRPVSLLFGRSPAGLNATGESDIRGFYDQLEGERERKLTPQIEKIARLVMLSKQGPTAGVLPERWSVEYPSLWQPTSAELADIRLKQAQTDTTYVNASVLSPEEVAVSRFRPEGFGEEISIDLDARDEPTNEQAELGPDGKPLDGAPIDAGAKPAETAMNGAQVSALIDIVKAVAAKELPRESALGIIQIAFPVTPEQAAKIVGTAGEGFVVAPKAPALPFGGGVPKALEPKEAEPEETGA